MLLASASSSDAGGQPGPGGVGLPARRGQGQVGAPDEDEAGAGELLLRRPALGGTEPPEPKVVEEGPGLLAQSRRESGDAVSWPGMLTLSSFDQSLTRWRGERWPTVSPFSGRFTQGATMA